MGGQGETGATAEVFILRWDKKNSVVQRSQLPDLPVSCANAAAVYGQGKLYVAGGDANGQGLSHFWALDLATALAQPARAAWVALPPWPGSRRFGAVLAVLKAEGREQLFLFGGRIKAVGPAMLSDYLDDAYRYDPASQKWTVLARMPHPALLAASARIGPSQLAVLGGSDGHDLDRMAELGERYRLPDHIAVYDADADRWHEGGRMPLGVVGAAVVELDSGWLVAGGEYSPGLRTAHVYQMNLKTVPKTHLAR
jgi:N-acetylneuraminic acid mutarotase